MWPTRPRWRMLCEGLLRDRIRSLGSFFPDPASSLGCVCISPAPQALGLGTVAEAGLLAGGSREDGTGLLNFVSIEPLRESPNRGWNVSRPSPNKLDGDISALWKAFRSRLGRLPGSTEDGGDPPQYWPSYDPMTLMGWWNGLQPSYLYKNRYGSVWRFGVPAMHRPSFLYKNWHGPVGRLGDR